MIHWSHDKLFDFHDKLISHVNGMLWREKQTFIEFDDFRLTVHNVAKFSFYDITITRYDSGLYADSSLWTIRWYNNGIIRTVRDNVGKHIYGDNVHRRNIKNVIVVPMPEVIDWCKKRNIVPDDFLQHYDIFKFEQEINRDN